ncbi:hypothetical protein HWV07_09765 [Natronomonas salina]|uniref:group I intron-associated PD-(D/E)XK endonuclease n=1 Tax=Natronomonas salina TaxID=1710540 RepID=UPI0015B5B51A|nr:group I intron-associated PD-(D/E)XK endonuclease [Natronomonas salina]QLD89298.1 hypothetical protein HWV07_09765 [Natronomonas salina]
MNTKDVGDTSEALVLAELTRRGYSVAVPFGDNDRYGLLVDADASLYRVQVKTGWREGDCIRFKTGSQTTADGEATVEEYTDTEIDAFAVRCRDSGGLFWVPLEAAGRKSTYLRVEDAAIDHPRVSYAEEYAFENALPPR